MIPYWVYVELPAFFLVGIITNAIFRWRAKTVIIFGLAVWASALVDYFVIAPMFHILFYLSTLLIGMGLCTLCVWMGWLVGFKLHLGRKKKCKRQK